MTKTAGTTTPPDGGAPLWEGMRPMGTAPKDGTPVLARIRPDLMEAFPNYGFGDSGRRMAGVCVVVRHPGLAPDGFDIGWSLAGPFGHGLGCDDVFEGWWHLPEQ